MSRLRGIHYPDRITGPRLTDKRIDHYRRQGYYGEAEQKAALAEQKSRRKKPKKKSGSSSEQDIMKQLEALLK